MSLHLCVVLNNIGGILYENGHCREAGQMYKVALQLSSHRLQQVADDRRGQSPEFVEVVQRGHALLENYKNAPQLHSPLVEGEERVPGSLYEKALCFPIELLQQREAETRKGSLNMIEALILATILFNVTMLHQTKLTDPHCHHRAKITSKVLRLYHQVEELAQRMIDHSSEETSSPACILSHFIKLAVLNNQAALHFAYFPHQQTHRQANEFILLLLKHAVSKQCRSTDWKDFPGLKDDATDFMVRAILQKSELDAAAAASCNGGIALDDLAQSMSVRWY